MDKEYIKEKLNNAAESGEKSLDNVKEILKILSKEISEKTAGKNENIQKELNELSKVSIEHLKSLGKATTEYIQAVIQGIIEGVKESGNSENNLYKTTLNHLLDSLKSLGDIGVYVAKESFKNLKETIEKNLKKNKEEKK